MSINKATRVCLISLPYGLVVRILAFHAGGPGSIPGVGKIFLIHFQNFRKYFITLTYIKTVASLIKYR